jgi:multicomponent Na+:H+ antiporter subunit C
MIDLLGSHYTYVAAMLILAVGLYGVIASPNLVKKVIGLNVFQVGIFLFFISSAYVEGGVPAIGTHGEGPFVSPLPHVLILTAIVVGVSLTALALALVVRIYDGYGVLDEDGVREVQTND